MDALKLRRTPLRTAFMKAVNQEITKNDPSNCTQEAYNIEFEAIEGYTEKMIVWQVCMKIIMEADASRQKDNHSLVTSSSSESAQDSVPSVFRRVDKLAAFPQLVKENP
ncbi:hypothetical protein TNCV_3727311 [Trichonephila clavipes]|uniref:Uncharacterized protein n=1 Tax=Trichonephila clavipes TaxID=2585209 RepID=A0A8X6UW98_TRICX|nr:hypothetical protein TNCV_3727311 [Trichonephila clavipes]